jgi:predicted extracellular nuclease
MVTLINEFQPNPTGTDPSTVLLELLGMPGASFSGVLVAIESDAGTANPGDINSFEAISGTFDANGLLTVSISDLENPSFTLALLDSFTGSTATDIDADNDGTADDLSTFGTVLDAIGIPDSVSDESLLYGAQLGGQDFAYTGDEPRLVFRDSATQAWFALNDPDNGEVFDVTGSDVTPAAFDTDPTAGTDTFGAANPAFDNSPPPPPPALTAIFDIQGAQHTSPLLGQSVTTEGIVTAVDTNGFYLQDATGDGNVATSDAIFVFTGGAPGVAVGDGLQVAGTVSEFTPGGVATGNLSATQISGPSISVLSTGNALPAAVLLGQGGRLLPSENIDDDAFASFDPLTDGIDFWESLEAMYVTAQDLMTIAGTNRFGEIFAVVDQGADATGISQRGTLNISLDDFNPERVQVNFDSGVFDFAFPNVNVGDLLGDVTGVVAYNFGNFEILPTLDFTSQIVDAALAAETTVLAGDADTLTVATYNVLNLDPNDADGDTDIADGRFDAVAQHILNNMNAPDIIGLQEVQDNSGSTDNGVTAADQTLQMLLDAIDLADDGLANSSHSYVFIDNTFIADNASGGQPGANIRTAFLYDTSRVSLVAGSVQPVGSQAPGEAFDGARLPLAATFVFNGEEVTVVNNYFSSKGGSSPILGVEQPFDTRQEDVTVNGSLDERQAQATEVAAFAEGLLTTDPNANVVVMGDLNEFEFVSPLTILEGAGLTNLTNDLEPEERYSFIFQGNSQSLDHILISDNLRLIDPDFDVVHVNTEFAETASRASDHDPLVVALNLPVGKNVVAGGSGDDLLIGTGANDLLTGRDGGDTILVRFGADMADGGAGADTFIIDGRYQGGGDYHTIMDLDFAGGDLLQFRLMDAGTFSDFVDPTNDLGIFGQNGNGAVFNSLSDIVEAHLNGVLLASDAGDGDTLLSVTVAGKALDVELDGVQFASLGIPTGMPDLSPGDDLLIGTGGDDSLFGYGGDDTLLMRFGMDIAEGGVGADLFRVDGRFVNDDDAHTIADLSFIDGDMLEFRFFDPGTFDDGADLLNDLFTTNSGATARFDSVEDILEANANGVLSATDDGLGGTLLTVTVGGNQMMLTLDGLDIV